MGILNTDLINIDLDDTDYDEDDPETFINIRLLAWHIQYEKQKTLKKQLNEEWHPKEWWNFCISADEKKEIEPIFTKECF